MIVAVDGEAISSAADLRTTIGVKRSGTSLTWDPAAERFTNDDQANAHLEGPEGRGTWGTA